MIDFNLVFFSALYYNNGVSSFNSSGRSSNCDEGDMQSDISLEEDVNDLNQKVSKEITNFCLLLKTAACVKVSNAG